MTGKFGKKGVAKKKEKKTPKGCKKKEHFTMTFGTRSKREGEING